MSMSETLISFETAKLAKEKGFNIETCDFFSEKIISNLVPQGDYKYLSVNYDNVGEDISPHGFWDWNSTNESKRLITAFNESYGENFKEVFSAPTQSLLQAWLREEHNIIVNSIPYEDEIPECEGDIRQTLWEDETIDCREIPWLRDITTHTYYHSYEESLENALVEGLKLINK